MSALPEDYSVVVVGGASGIGRAAALHLAAAGACVTVVDRDEAGAVATATAAGEGGGRAIGVPGDVTDPVSIRSALDAARAAYGQIHALANTAGIQGPLGKPSHQVEIADFERTLRVNLTGALVIARELMPHLLDQGYGRVAHVASIAGKEGNPNMVAYSASKAGLIGLVKTQGKEYAGTGVTVNAIAPAVIRTEFLETQPPEVVQYMVDKIPMGRVGTPQEVAELITWILSPACSFTTGFTFDLSGGRATY